MLKINARWVIRFEFFAGAVLFGLWAVRIAEFRQLQGLSHSQLGLLMLAPPVTLMITMTQVSKFTQLFGIRNLIVIGTALWAIVLFFVSLIPPIWLTFILFLFFGAGAAILEIGLNAVAQKIDRDDRPIMLSAHGFWSLGFMAGSVIGGWLGEHGISFFTQQLIFSPLIFILVALGRQKLPTPLPPKPNPKNSMFSLAVLPLCLIPFAALLLEGAMGDWASVFLSEERAATPLQFGLITGGFMGGMAISRLSGDNLRRHFSVATLLIASTLIAIAGLAFFCFGQPLWLIGVGALACGVGVGVVYPLTIVFANEGKDEEEASRIIASIAAISFVAFLFAPPFMGFVAEKYSLSLAFSLLIPALFLTFFWMWLAKKQG